MKIPKPVYIADYINEIARLRAINAELLAALKRLVAAPDVVAEMLSPETIVAADDARAAITKAEKVQS